MSIKKVNTRIDQVAFIVLTFILYVILLFVSTKIVWISIKYPTEKGISKSYVNNRPVLGKRKRFEAKQLLGMKFNKEDKNLLIVFKRRKYVILK